MASDRNNNRKKRVLVAMSGGVDSSTTAALLKDEGYEVIGANMRLWYRDKDEEIAEQNAKGCCSLKASHDAKRVADKLDIPFYVMNFKEIFYQQVVKDFINEYMKGRTPNPCIACNKYLKWQKFLQKALELECDYIATGHYARIKYDEKSSRYLLYMAVDDKKDQTYMLYNMDQEELFRTLFPLGDYSKAQTRELAAKYDLVTSNKPESQDICFIPDNDYRKFISEEAPKKIKKGPIVNLKGEKLGEHKGIPYYTIGQRKGLGISLGRPQYVVDIDIQKNAVIIGDKEDLLTHEFIAEDVNWIAFDSLDNSIEVDAKIRYNAEPVPSKIIPLPEQEGKVKVEFKEPEEAVAPGQAVVFYDGEMVVGGGTIKESCR